MILSKTVAAQLSHPTGVFGRLVLPRLWNRRNATLNDLTFNMLTLNPRDRVLEVGFGGGYLLGRMAGTVTEGLIAGVDVSQAMVDFSQNQYRSLIKAGKVDLKAAGAESLPFPDHHFSKVCSVNSIFYWQDATQAIAEFWRVLADDGLLVLCFTSKESLEDKGFVKHGHITLYTADEVQQMLEAARFDNIRMDLAADKHRDFWCVTARK